jgi:hypothetical protein
MKTAFGSIEFLEARTASAPVVNETACGSGSRPRNIGTRVIRIESGKLGVWKFREALSFALGTLATTIRLALGALFFTTATPRVDAVILMEVIDFLTLFEVEGLEFPTYATSERATIRVLDTADGFEGRIDVHGQSEPRGSLTLLAVSIADPRQQVRLELDTQPLDGPPRIGLTTLQSRPVPIEPPPVTDRALQPFADPLFLGFRFVSSDFDPQTGITRSTYQLERLDVPEPSNLLLSALGCGLLALRHRPHRFQQPQHQNVDEY